jgi:hypothetical protein
MKPRRRASKANPAPRSFDERTRITEALARADAGATLAAQAIAGDVSTEAALKGMLAFFERIRLALKV